MSNSTPILLRFQSKNGQFRLTVNPKDEFPSLLSGVSGIISAEALVVQTKNAVFE